MMWEISRDGRYSRTAYYNAGRALRGGTVTALIGLSLIAIHPGLPWGWVALAIGATTIAHTWHRRRQIRRSWLEERR